MPLRREPPRPLAALLLLALSALPAHAAGYLDSPAQEKPFRPFIYLEGGIDLYATPDVAVYCERWRSWELGLELRSWVVNAESPYDMIPETSLHVRKLWLSSEEQESLAGSEYVDVSLGLAPGYRFLTLDEVAPNEFRPEPRVGAIPGLRLILGKNWMPFTSVPIGIDFNIAVGHYFQGHPPAFEHINFATASVSLFFVPGFEAR
jgi:hypothetical protein